MPGRMNRRDFLKSSLLLSAVGFSHHIGIGPGEKEGFCPGVISTWDQSEKAAIKARELLVSGSAAVDVVEKGVKVAELDPEITSVGYGGLPDENGIVTLDASIMDGRGHRAGSVAFLQNIKTPVSVARLIMDKTKHVMLNGTGALEFAKKMGFKEENLLTDTAREMWLAWKKISTSDRTMMKTHDTITMLCLDKHGNLAGACSTSGSAWKLHGRVGDSPIIGAGLYVDNEVGAAGATGVGELVLRTLSSFTIVENMKRGLSPADACEDAFIKMCRKIPEAEETDEAFIAINKKGEAGCFSNTGKFTYFYASEKNLKEYKPLPVK